MKKFFLLFLISLIVFAACSEKKDSNYYPPVDDSIYEKNDLDEQLPLNDEYLPNDQENIDEKEVEDSGENGDEDVLVPDEEIEDIEAVDEEDQDEDNLNDEDDPDEDEDVSDDEEPVLPVPCFNKLCLSHEDCSVSSENCTPFDVSDTFACGPDNLEDFGYRGKERCLQINCEEDSDCKGGGAYVCVHFGAPVPEFLDAESVCVRSLAGSDCDEEGKRICQFGRNLTLKCVDGKWKSYLCSSTSYCEDGECKPIVYPAKMVISVDDLLVNLCVNGQNITPLGTNRGNWTMVDEYHFNFIPGINVIGVHGRDTGQVISAFMATVEVAGELYVTDGVLPPDEGIEYTPTDPEWDATLWRYFPEMVGSPRSDWCDKYFDDSDWGPAIRAGGGDTPDEEWGHLGTDPWLMTSCGYDKCPGEFLHYYEDLIEGNEPMWVWDYKPVDLNDAWFRFVIVMP